MNVIEISKPKKWQKPSFTQEFSKIYLLLVKLHFLTKKADTCLTNIQVLQIKSAL